MKIKVAFFAQSREIVGKSEIDYELSEGAEVSVLIEKLQSQFPGLAAMKFMVAVNSDYVKNDHKLHDGDKAAIIPPVSGG
jgi:molybdopterin synthase sulfur carrier subunit